MSSGSGPGPRPQRGSLVMPMLLALLALLDLRVELQLLLEHFTWTSLSQIPLQHPLATAVLLFTPAMLRRP